MQKFVSIIFFLNNFDKKQFQNALNKLLNLKVKNEIEILISVDPCTPKEFLEIITQYKQANKFAEFHNVRVVMASQELAVSRAFEQALNVISGDYVVFLANNLSINENFSFHDIQEKVDQPDADIIGIYNEKNDSAFASGYLKKNYLASSTELNEKLIFFFMLNNTFVNIYRRDFLISSNVFRDMKEHFYPFFFKLQLLSKIKKWSCLKSDVFTINRNCEIPSGLVYDTYFQMIHLINDQNLKKLFLTKSTPFYKLIEFLIVYLLLVQFVDMLSKTTLENNKQLDLFIKLAYNFVIKYFPNYTKNVYLKQNTPFTQYLLKFKPEKKYITKSFPK